MRKRDIALALVLAVCALSGCKSPEQLQMEQNADAQTLIIKQLPVEPLDLITVTGTAGMLVYPDTALLRLAVRSLAQEEDEDGAAVHQNRVNEAAQALLEFGVEKSDISQSIMMHYPQNATNQEGHKLGFTQQTVLSVTLHELDLLELLLFEVIREDIVLVGEVEYTCSTLALQYEQALGKAVAMAEQKARALSEAMQVQLTQSKAAQEESAAMEPLAHGDVLSGKVYTITVTMTYSIE